MTIPPLSGGPAELASPEALRTELSAVGFEDVDVRQVEAVWISASVDEFLSECDRLYGHIPPYANFGQAERDHLLPALRQVAEGYAADGVVKVLAPGLVAAGRRA
ncbi:MAG: hypothetical protein P4M05_25220 [Bradyrhizobium sp.]|nr:hypothetical protein [Bradyrhizobium sp.]